jgi:hypothetical protein
VEKPDHGHRRLLRVGRERPRRRAAEQRDERATSQLIGPHSISHQPSRIAEYQIYHCSVSGPAVNLDVQFDFIFFAE